MTEKAGCDITIGRPLLASGNGEPWVASAPRLGCEALEHKAFFQSGISDTSVVETHSSVIGLFICIVRFVKRKTNNRKQHTASLGKKCHVITTAKMAMHLFLPPPLFLHWSLPSAALPTFVRASH